MSDELELLDQLEGGDLPLTVTFGLFSDSKRFQHAVSAMLSTGEIRLLDNEGGVVPSWRWAQVLSSNQLEGFKLAITKLGCKRIA